MGRQEAGGSASKQQEMCDVDRTERALCQGNVSLIAENIR